MTSIGNTRGSECKFVDWWIRGMQDPLLSRHADLDNATLGKFGRMSGHVAIPHQSPELFPLRPQPPFPNSPIWLPPAVSVRKWRRVGP